MAWAWSRIAGHENEQGCILLQNPKGYGHERHKGTDSRRTGQATWQDSRERLNSLTVSPAGQG